MSFGARWLDRLAGFMAIRHVVDAVRGAFFGTYDASTMVWGSAGRWSSSPSPSGGACRCSARRTHDHAAYGDAFADTDLEDVLAARAVGELILVGAASEQCIRCTMHSAVVGGYDVALVTGAHTTSDLTEYGMPEPAVVVGFMDLIAGYGMQWPGRTGRSVTPAEVDL